MRLALVVAPADPALGDASARREALAWLRGQLARRGFDVVIVGAGLGPMKDIEAVLESVSHEDMVVVHASGRLSGRDSLAFGKAGDLPLRALCDAVAARAPAQASFVLELMYVEDAAVGGECMAMAVRSLHARERGYSVLAAVRSLSAGPDRIAFTRATLPGVEVETNPEALLSTMYDRAATAPESQSIAESFTFVRGAIEAPQTQRDIGLVDDDTDEPAEARARAEPIEPIESVEAIESGVEGLAISASDPPESLAPPEDPAQAASIHSLIAEATEAQDWPRAVELRLERLEGLPSARHKVRELIAIARILQVEMHDADGAIQALEEARVIEPGKVSVLQALRRGYETQGRWGSAVEVIGALVDLAQTPAERIALRLGQALLSATRLEDPEGALAILETVLEDDPSNAEALAEVARLRLPSQEPDPAAREKQVERIIAEGQDDAALAELESIAQREPLRASIYGKAFHLHRREGRTDSAFLAAMALEELEGADVEQQVLIEQFRSVGPVRARAMLDAGAWESLRAAGSDDVLAALFAAVERAAVAVKVEELRAARRLPVLDPSKKLSETSTASIGRTFQWAARVLGIACPDLYLVSDSGPGGVWALQARAPSTALGPSVVSGPSAKELAFLAGRHLAYYRPEYHPLLYYSTRDELTKLLFAAVQVSMPGAASRHPDPSVAALRGSLARQLGQDERLALDAAVRRLDARGGRASVGAWMRSAELTAARAGLLLCGDLAVATAYARSEARAQGEVTAQALRGDLVTFCASRAHATLRARFLGPESGYPPAPAASRSGAFAAG
ncbi:MAG TPA: hypothetical protein VKU41_05455 [Polyangiaceae bacterium]|nr:hypothetical protein [Polyangiaceae bacterium]